MFKYFSGSFSKLRNVTISFVMSVRVQQLSSNWMDFHEIWVYFPKSVKKIQVLIKSDKGNGYFTCRPILYMTTNMHFSHISFSSSKNKKRFRQNLCRKSEHCMFNNFFRKSCRFETMCKHWVIWGFRRAVVENRVLLSYYAASDGNILPTFRDTLSENQEIVPKHVVENIKNKNTS